MTTRLSSVGLTTGYVSERHRWLARLAINSTPMEGISMATIANVIENKRVNGQANGQVKSNGPSREDLLARIAELEAKVNAPKLLQKLYVKVMDVLSDGTAGKGGVAVFGLQRNPVTLYAEQWERLLDGCNPTPESPVAAILQACKSPKATRKNRE